MGQVRKHQHFPLNRRQPGKRAPQLPAVVRAIVGLDGRDGCVRPIVDQDVRGVPSRGAKVVQGETPDDAEQPGAEACPVAAGVEALEGAHESFLREIFRRGMIAGDGERADERRSLMPFNERRERLAIAGQDGADEDVIRDHSEAALPDVTIRAMRPMA